MVILTKYLILVPAETARGGVMNYYKILRKDLPESFVYVFRGSRNYPYREGFFRRKIRLLSDYIQCAKLLKSGKFSVLQTTTSFSTGALIRDSVYIFLAKQYNVKSIVFFHGGDNKLFPVIEKNWLFLFRSIYFKADAMIDLSKKNIDWFKCKGYKGKLFLETTAVDKELLSETDENSLNLKHKKNSPVTHLLFLARIEKTKGIYEAIDAFAIVKKNREVKISIVGDGLELDNIKEYVSKRNITDVTFHGHLVDHEKAEIFKEADIYIFPSYYEGMPTSVLEAMSFGLPVVTSAVGGLPDFFINDLHGYITGSKDPAVYAELIMKIMDDNELKKKMSLNNFRYARQHFKSDLVGKRVKEIFNDVVSSSNN